MTLLEPLRNQNRSSWARFHQRSTYSFYARSSPKRKNSVKCQYLFTLLGPTSVKAACRTLMKLTPGTHGSVVTTTLDPERKKYKCTMSVGFMIWTYISFNYKWSLKIELNVQFLLFLKLEEQNSYQIYGKLILQKCHFVTKNFHKFHKRGFKI